MSSAPNEGIALGIAAFCPHRRRRLAADHCIAEATITPSRLPAMAAVAEAMKVADGQRQIGPLTTRLDVVRVSGALPASGRDAQSSTRQERATQVGPGLAAVERIVGHARPAMKLRR